MICDKVSVWEKMICVNVSVLEKMICVRNYRPSVISIGRRLTNSALALATFSPIASLQHLEKLEFIGRKCTISRFPFFTYSDVLRRQNFFSVERCPLDGDFTISLPICLSCPLLAIFWPPSL